MLMDLKNVYHVLSDVKHVLHLISVLFVLKIESLQIPVVVE